MGEKCRWCVTLFFPPPFFLDIYGHYFISFDRSVVASLLFNAKKKKQQKWKTPARFFSFSVISKNTQKGIDKTFLIPKIPSFSVYEIEKMRDGVRSCYLNKRYRRTSERHLAVWRHAKWTSPYSQFHCNNRTGANRKEDKDEYLLH